MIECRCPYIFNKISTYIYCHLKKNLRNNLWTRHGRRSLRGKNLNSRWKCFSCIPKKLIIAINRNKFKNLSLKRYTYDRDRPIAIVRPRYSYVGNLVYNAHSCHGLPQTIRAVRPETNGHIWPCAFLFLWVNGRPERIFSTRVANRRSVAADRRNT